MLRKQEEPSLCPMHSVEGVSAFDPEILSRPESFWAKLRQDHPVYEVTLPESENRVFFITRMADIDKIATQPDRFSSRALPSIFRWPDQPPEILEVFGGQKFASTFVTSDPPEHRQYRRVADAGLSLKEVRHWEAMIQAIVTRLVENFPQDESFDFVSLCAVPLPSETIRTILGLPEEDADFLIWFTDEYMGMVDPSTPLNVAIERAHGVRRAQEYLIPKIEMYRAEPADNFFSTLANARREDGSQMSMEEVLSMVIITIIGGNETTRNALASTAFFLATRPDIWVTLKTDRTRVASFVNEAIRLAAPATFLPRTVLVDTELHGVHLPKGSTLFLFWASGNRDETVFPFPDRVDLDRTNSRSNVTFGKGPHFCAGNHLARMEIMLTVEALLDNFETFDLTVPPDQVRYEPILQIRTLKEVPIRVSRPQR